MANTGYLAEEQLHPETQTQTEAHARRAGRQKRPLWQASLSALLVQCAIYDLACKEAEQAPHSRSERDSCMAPASVARTERATGGQMAPANGADQ